MSALRAGFFLADRGKSDHTALHQSKVDNLAVLDAYEAILRVHTLQMIRCRDEDKTPLSRRWCLYRLLVSGDE